VGKVIEKGNIKCVCVCESPFQQLRAPSPLASGTTEKVKGMTPASAQVDQVFEVVEWAKVGA
jgi:hypothetical protein